MTIPMLLHGAYVDLKDAMLAMLDAGMDDIDHQILDAVNNAAALVQAAYDMAIDFGYDESDLDDEDFKPWPVTEESIDKLKSELKKARETSEAFHKKAQVSDEDLHRHTTI